MQKNNRSRYVQKCPEFVSAFTIARVDELKHELLSCGSRLVLLPVEFFQPPEEPPLLGGVRPRHPCRRRALADGPAGLTPARANPQPGFHLVASPEFLPPLCRTAPMYGQR